MTEDRLKANVIDACQKLGFRVAHFRPALTSKGYRTAVEGDGAGFPDLVISGHGLVMFVELKSDKGKLSVEQIDWRNSLLANGAEWDLWRPSDWTNGNIEWLLMEKRREAMSGVGKGPGG